MIAIEPDEPGTVYLTPEQAIAIARLGVKNDLRVAVSVSRNLQIYVGPYGKEPRRHWVSPEGETGLIEVDLSHTGEWVPE